MHKIIASLVAIAAGCGSASRAPSVPHNAGGPRPPIGPAPSITWTAAENDYGSFATKGMPALAYDGSRVLLAEQQQGAGMTPPNLTLRELDRDDHEAARQEVLPFNQGGDATAPKPGAVDAANAFLKTSNEALGWTAMTEIAAAGVPDPGSGDDGDTSPRHTEKSRVASGDLDVVFDNNGHLTVHDGAKVVVDKDVATWLAPPQHTPDGDCGNPAFLDHAYVDAAHRLAVVVIGYSGTDSCWEPSPETHVVTW